MYYRLPYSNVIFPKGVFENKQFAEHVYAVTSYQYQGTGRHVDYVVFWEPNELEGRLNGHQGLNTTVDGKLHFMPSTKSYTRLDIQPLPVGCTDTQKKAMASLYSKYAVLRYRACEAIGAFNF
jgi:hypothetical protein